jgi:hypothetical protein
MEDAVARGRVDGGGGGVSRRGVERAVHGQTGGVHGDVGVWARGGRTWLGCRDDNGSGSDRVERKPPTTKLIRVQNQTHTRTHGCIFKPEHDGFRVPVGFVYGPAHYTRKSQIRFQEQTSSYLGEAERLNY